MNTQLLTASDDSHATIEKVKSHLIANISHDLRTPLHTMLGIAELLHIKKHYPEQEELIAGIIESGKSLLKLVEQMLQFSELENKPSAVITERINLYDMLQDLIATHHKEASDKNITLRLHYAETVPQSVLSHRGHLLKILHALLNNAVKFTQHGCVSVDVSVAGHSQTQATLQFRVSDTGPGIATHELPFIFDYFYRISPSYTGQHKGAGLGLAIAKQLTERLGGVLNVNSQPGVGSCFTCTLPLTLDESQQRSMPSTETRQLHVLLVEDEPLIQKFTQAMLTEFGCRVTLAETGERALQLAQRPFDLIFLDIGLPDMSGVEVATQLRTTPQANVHTPIIAVTAHVGDDDRARCLAAGIDAFLKKPASFQDFRQLIQQVRTQHAMRRALKAL